MLGLGSLVGFGRNGRNKNGKNPANGYLISLDNVVKTYQTAAGDFPALKGIDLKVNRGEFLSVVGKSGSGKSTLVNMITGIDRPTSGDVIVNGTRLNDLRESEMARWRGLTVGIVFQFFQLMPSISVLDNVMLPMDFCRLYSRRERIERGMALLESVHIAEHAHKKPTEVSGGQQQRVAIARALATDPPLVVCDEPTGNLDSRTANAVFKIFWQLVGDGKTIVMVTHDKELAQRVDRVINLEDGLIVNGSQPGETVAETAALEAVEGTLV